jgi:hypothetical protein
MKKYLLGFLFLCNCAIGPTHGFFYTSTKFPGEFNPHNDVPRTKSATGCQYNYLGIIVTGEAAAGEIALKNGIKRIAVIDHSTKSILTFVYATFCTTIYGE